MTRDEILDAVRDIVKRTGRVPGRASFERESGIRKHEWYGRYWPRWGDALVEAGFEPNEKTAAGDRDSILAAYLGWIEELGRVPTEGELRVRNHMSKEFPGREAIRAQLGLKSERVRALLEHAVAINASEHTLEILRAAVDASPISPAPRENDEAPTSTGVDGFVYLMKSGKNFKIGRTNTVDRRQYEIGVQLPEKLEPVHSIRTDDPSGIEAYWHSRFRNRRLNGE